MGSKCGEKAFISSKKNTTEEYKRKGRTEKKEG